jgi:hypothetical protein
MLLVVRPGGVKMNTEWKAALSVRISLVTRRQHLFPVNDKGLGVRSLGPCDLIYFHLSLSLLLYFFFFLISLFQHSLFF